jgi:hypothetical protein
MLVEHLDVTPQPPIGKRLEDTYRLLGTDEFETSLLCGDIATKTEPLEYLDMYLLWYKKVQPLPVRFEAFGDPQRLMTHLKEIPRLPEWSSRIYTLTTALSEIKAIADLRTDPYLVGAVGNIRTTSRTPIIVCFQRNILSPGLVAAVCSYHLNYPSP